MEGMGPFSGLPDLKILVGESESETDMSPVAGTSIQVPLPNHIVKTEQTSLPKMEAVTSNASSPDNLVIDLPEDALPALSHKAPVSVGDSVLRFREQAASTGSPRAGENGPAVSDPMAVMGLQILAEAVEERRMHPKLSSSPLPSKQHQLAAPLTPSSATSSLGIGQHLKVYPSASSAKHYIVKSHSNPNTDIVLRVQGTEVDITTTSSSGAIQGDMSFGQSLPFPISTLSAPYPSHTLAEEDRGTAPPAPEEDLETMVQRFMAKYCEEVGDSHMTRVKDVPVKDLRHIIPLLIMNIYGSRADSSQKKSKVKGLWWKRPDDWPESVPFCDPNNSKRTTPDGSASKPKKETLSQMFDFLLKKYMEMMQSMKGEFPIQSLISPMKTDSKADVRHIMGIVGDSRTCHQSSLDMLANVAVVNESHHSTYTGGPRPPKVMKLEQATASPTQTTLPQGLDLSTMKSNVGERTCTRPIVKTFEVKRNGTTAAGSIRAISTHYNRASSITRPVLEQRQPIIIRPVVPLTPRGPRISLNPRISSPATDQTLLKVENGASSGNSTHPSPSPHQVSSNAENNNVPQTVTANLPINILPPASTFLSDPVPPPPRPVNSIEGDSVPVCPPLPPPSYVLEETPSLNPLLTSPSVKTSTQESPAVDLTKPKPGPVTHHSTCQEPVARQSEMESGDLVTPWDPVMDISNRLNSKVNYFDKNCVLPDQQRGLILIVRDTLRKMREVLSGEEGPSVHTFLDATHSFECTLDVAQVKKHIPEAECVRWHNFIAKWYIKVVRQSNEASCENG